jgi:hypothetical protein
VAGRGRRHGRDGRKEETCRRRQQENQQPGCGVRDAGGDCELGLDGFGGGGAARVAPKRMLLAAGVRGKACRPASRRDSDMNQPQKQEGGLPVSQEDGPSQEDGEPFKLLVPPLSRFFHPSQGRGTGPARGIENEAFRASDVRAGVLALGVGPYLQVRRPLSVRTPGAGRNGRPWHPR